MILFTPGNSASDLAYLPGNGEEDGLTPNPSKEYGKPYMNFDLICIPRENRCLLRLPFGQKADTISDPKAALFAPFRTIALVSPLSSSDLKTVLPVQQIL